MEKQTNMSDLELLKLAYEAASKVAPVLVEFQERGFKTEYKDDASPVTEADIAADNLITATLKKSELLIVSEEGSRADMYARSSHERFWVVDPLDGTKEFIAGRPDFTINIGLIHQGTPILGVIVHPRVNKAYLGLASLGFTQSDCRETFPSETSFTTEIPTLDIPHTAVVSRSHLKENTLNYLKEIRQKHPDLQVIRAGSSLKFCKLALGEAHLYPRFSPCMIWDTAAGDAILRSVGKKIVQMEGGEDLDYVDGRLVNPSFLAE